MEKNKVILDGTTFRFHHIENKNGFYLYLCDLTEFQKQKIVALYRKVKSREPAAIELDEYSGEAEVQGVMCSGESEIGLDLKNYGNISSCTIVLNIDKEDCKRLVRKFS